MIRFFTFNFFMLLSVSLFAQTPSSCFEIESILVNSCDGNAEGKNEMFTFHVGNTALNMTNFYVANYASGNVNWNNPGGNHYKGICQNATTAQKVATLNASITACGQLIEPPGGIIPAGAKVIFMMSSDFDFSANDFSNLSETYYIVFQCAGNTNGHFANSSSPPPATVTRKLKIGFSTPAACTDEVIYSLNSLPNADGATVLYDWSGTATYTNNGCHPPIVTPNVSTTYTNTFGSGNVCLGNSIALTGIASNNFTSYTWSGGNGIFSSTTTKNTSYTPNSNESGTIILTFTATDPCTSTNNGVSTINIFVKNTPISSITGNNTICNGETTVLNSGFQNALDAPFTYAWSPSGLTTPNITTSLLGTHTVTVTNSCGSKSSTPFLITAAPSFVKITADKAAPYCNGEIVKLSSSSVNGNSWSTGETSSFIEVKNSGTYSLNVSGCNGILNDEITIAFSNIKADFEPSTIEGNIPLEIIFTNKSENAVNYLWDFGDSSSTSNLTNPNHTYLKEGQYIVTLIAKNSNNCSDTMSYTFIKVSKEIFIQIPNVFSPNNDKINDLFEIKSSGVKQFECFIYNRWGNEVAKLKDIATNWDGGDCANGVYFYLINVTFIDNSTKEYKGNVTLLR